jgi:murein DD-endopeptidase MepM/ murein hydrolase activator NlpD
VPRPEIARVARGQFLWLAFAVFALFVASGQAAALDLPSRPGVSSSGSAAPTEGSGAVAAPSTEGSGAVAAAPRRQHVVIKRGQRGQRVMQLQRRLRANGIRLKLDGRYGLSTVKAVRRAQRKLGLKVTGIATPALQRRLGLPAPIAAGSAVSEYLVAFPMPKSANYRYFNDYFSPRGTGPHGATDIMAPLGVPILAATHGTVMDLRRTDSGLGGLYVYIRDPGGTWYYYAHLSSISPGLQPGDTVWPGRVIGRNGATGNASFGAEHLHLEIMKGKRGGPTINPFPHLAAVDPKPRSETDI